MKVSDLSTILPSEHWNMYFAANCPYTGINASGMYSNALADRGDDFYFQAVNDPQGNRSYVWGTVARQSTGSIALTQQGTADSGTFDPATSTITVSVAISKLNAFVTHGPAIGSGTVLAGLHGSSALTLDGVANAREDYANGGIEFTIP